jgi:hypothetical protein
MTTNLKMSQFQNDVGDSKSLTNIDGQKFTIVKIENSNYEKNGKISEGVKITTQEEFDVEGEKFNKFHTTRTTIVPKLRDETLKAAVNGIDGKDGTPLGPVKCQLEKAKQGGNDYYILVDA